MSIEDSIVTLFSAFLGGSVGSLLTYKLSSFKERNRLAITKINHINNTNAACIHALNEIINFKMNLFIKIYEKYEIDRIYFLQKIRKNENLEKQIIIDLSIFEFPNISTQTIKNLSLEKIELPAKIISSIFHIESSIMNFTKATYERENYVKNYPSYEANDRYHLTHYFAIPMYADNGTCEIDETYLSCMNSISMHIDESLAFLCETINDLENLAQSIKEKYGHIDEIQQVHILKTKHTENTKKGLPNMEIISQWRNRYIVENKNTSLKLKFIEYTKNRFSLIKDFLTY